MRPVLQSTARGILHRVWDWRKNAFLQNNINNCLAFPGNTAHLTSVR
jgi:hypothetical protein